MKKFKQTEATVNAVGMLLFLIIGFLAGVALDPAFKFNPDNWRAVVLGLITAFIGWIAMTIQNENRKIAYKKLLLDGYKEKQGMEINLQECFESFYKIFYDIKKSGDITYSNMRPEPYYRFENAKEMLTLINEIKKISSNYIFLLSVLKVDTNNLLRILSLIDKNKGILYTYSETPSNNIKTKEYKEISYIATGCKRLNEEISRIKLKVED